MATTKTRKTTAAKAPKKAPAKKAAATKPATKKVTAKKSWRPYPEWTPDAVKRGNALAAGRPTAGPSQHIKVRAAITEHLGGTVTPDAILKVSGCKSVAALKKIATGSAPPTPLRPLSAMFREDGWAQRRHLAVVLVVWIEDLRAAK